MRCEPFHTKNDGFSHLTKSLKYPEVLKKLVILVNIRDV
jgi:hypothetical protein